MKRTKHCQLIQFYKFLGKKWSVELMHSFKKEPISFNELEKKTRHYINPSLLSSRLKEMIEFRILERKRINNKICYVLTKQGNQLKEKMHEIKLLAIDFEYKIPKECTKQHCACTDVFNT